MKLSLNLCSDASSPVVTGEPQAVEEAPLTTDGIDVEWDNMRPAVEITHGPETTETVALPTARRLASARMSMHGPSSEH